VQAFEIEVIGIPPQITSTPLLEAVPGTTYSYTLTVTGAPAPTLSVTTTLPDWLSFNASTRTLSGTPGDSDQRTDVEVTIQADNGVPPAASQTFIINVKRKPGANVGGNKSSGGCITAEPANGSALLILLAAALALRTRRREAAGSTES
jgi:hypothetical protein